MKPRAGLGIFGKEKTLTPARNQTINSQTTIPHPSHYAVSAILSPIIRLKAFVIGSYGKGKG
jgi:hypothetical protein